MSRTYHPASQLPTPGIPLVVELADGTRLNAIRPSHVSSYDQDPDYRDPQGQRISGVVKWAIR